MSENLNSIKMINEIFSSNRGEELEQALEQLAVAQWREKEWLYPVFSSLFERLITECILIRELFLQNSDDISLIAWRARNLLELAMWTFFCIETEENARQFYDDGIRDFHDVAKNLEKWETATNQGNDQPDTFKDAYISLQEVADKYAVKEPLKKYTPVHNAAQKVNLAEHFSITNKFLSKFSHPTAVSLLGLSKSDSLNMKDGFFNFGFINFLGAFHKLKLYLELTAQQKTD